METALTQLQSAMESGIHSEEQEKTKAEVALHRHGRCEVTAALEKLPSPRWESTPVEEPPLDKDVEEEVLELDAEITFLSDDSIQEPGSFVSQDSTQEPCSLGGSQGECGFHAPCTALLALFSLYPVTPP
jgi:hypothetical protein